MSRKTLRIAVIFEDTCREDSEYSINDILAYDSVEEFLNRGGVKTVVAYEHFLSGEKRPLISFLQNLRKIVELDYKAYFLTPFGLVHETKIIAPYKECLNSFDQDKIDFFFTEAGVFEDLQKLFLDEETPFIIMFLGRRLAKYMRLEEWAPSNKKIILVTDAPFRVDSESVITIYPSEFIERKAQRILELKGKREYYEIAWKLIYKFLLFMVTNRVNPGYITRNIKDATQLIGLLEEEQKKTKQIKLTQRETESEIQIIIFPYEKVTVREGENAIIKREIKYSGEELIKHIQQQGLMPTIKIIVDEALLENCKSHAKKLATLTNKIECIKENATTPLIITNDTGETVKIYKPNKQINIEYNGTIVITGLYPPDKTNIKTQKTIWAIEVEELDHLNKITENQPPENLLILTKQSPDKTTQQKINEATKERNISLYTWDGEKLQKIEQGKPTITDTQIRELLTTKTKKLQ